MSKQSDDNEPRRDRLIKYLMDELDPEEKFEIEKLCNLILIGEQKKLIQQSLSLLIDAGHDGFRLDRDPGEGLFSQEEKIKYWKSSKIKPQGKSDGRILFPKENCIIGSRYCRGGRLLLLIWVLWKEKIRRN